MTAPQFSLQQVHIKKRRFFIICSRVMLHSQDQSGVLHTGKKGEYSAGEQEFMKNVQQHNISHLDTRLQILKGCVQYSFSEPERFDELPWDW